MLVERESGVDIWSMHDLGKEIVIPTNGVVKKNGEAVMGRGLALDAARRWDWLPEMIGRFILSHGNRVYRFTNELIDDKLHIFTFPTKEDWRDPASLDLIQRSAVDLKLLIEESNERNEKEIREVYLPRVGCGAGGLHWRDVRMTLKFALERSNVIFTIVHK